MKKTRFIALLCALVLLVSLAPMASAKSLTKVRNAPAANAVGWHSNLIVKNGETHSFEVFPYAYNLYEPKTKSDYSNILYDCKGVVKAKSSVSWISITEYGQGFILNIDTNTTQKTRSGKVTVTGKSFKATLNFKQYGMDKLAGVTRSKNKVTLKIKYGSAPKHYLSVYTYKSAKDGSNTNKTIYSDLYKKGSYSFTIKKGWRYSISVGPALKMGSYTNWDSTDWLSFTASKVTGTETLK